MLAVMRQQAEPEAAAVLEKLVITHRVPEVMVALVVTEFKMIGAQALTSTTVVEAVVQGGVQGHPLLVVKVVEEHRDMAEVMLVLLVLLILAEVGEVLTVRMDRIGPVLVAVRE